MLMEYSNYTPAYGYAFDDNSDSTIVDCDSDDGSTIILSDASSESSSIIVQSKKYNDKCCLDDEAGSSDRGLEQSLNDLSGSLWNDVSIITPLQKQRHLDDLLKEEREAVGQILVANCCKGECLLHLTAHAVLTTRKRVSCLKSRGDRRQWFVDKISESSKIVNGKLETSFCVGGSDVCKKAFCIVYNLPSKYISDVTKSVEKGHLTIEHGNSGSKRPTAKSEGAKVWMEKYFHLLGDKMPNSNQIHLPSWDTQKDIYARYKQDMAQQMLLEKDLISLSMFYRIWQEEFSHVVIPEV